MLNNEKTDLAVRFLLCQCGDFFEQFWVILRYLRENFAVKTDLSLFEATDQLAIRNAEFAAGGTDTVLPDATHRAFLELAAAVGVFTCLKYSNFCKFDFAFATPHVTLGLFEKGCAAFKMGFSSFYT